LLKSFVLTARTPEPDLLSLRLYNSAARGVLEHLVQRTATFPPTVYIAERKGGRVIHRTEHLACFFPGTLALGFIVTAPDYASALSREARESPEFAALNASRLVHIDAAIKLARTCVALYDASPSRLAPDSARLAADGRSLEAEDPKFLLRPETAESLFLLFRATGDARWREDGWRIFQAIQRQCRTPTAYSGAADTRRDPAVLNDSMQSFFLAETVKYLFLLFAPRDAFDLAQWVLTTEAHPLRVL
jgi:mannosyl-oligosaccharide alpha-1,2-mannosidase